jgi:hypothetical protein
MVLAYSSTLKMKATSSSETSVDFQRTTRRHFPEDRTLHAFFCGRNEDYFFFIQVGAVTTMLSVNGPWRSSPC